MKNITVNAGSLVLSEEGKPTETIPRGKQTAVTAGEEVVTVTGNGLRWKLNVETTTLDGVSYATSHELAEAISVFNRGGGSGTGAVDSVTGDLVDNTDPANPVVNNPTWNQVQNKPLKTLSVPIDQSEGLVPVYTQNGQLPVGIPQFPENAVPLVVLDVRLDSLTLLRRTQAQYDAIPVKDTNTLYIING